MAATVKPTHMILIIFAVAMAVTGRGEAAISCSSVASYLNPCLPYVTNKGPLGGCCNGIKGLFAAAKTTADRQSVCNCLKSLAGSTAGISPDKAAGLPGQCGINIPYKISPSTDCAKVN
ncbi:hypothetical protein CDL12_21691 [Handroanthus impetiginosus]|uniref:Non-specific lipid-transfer protein n=1 Tax=Handroanthus impetiginosus TaxID=429701 RepID=A0A2G9GKI2_9LAMI|nr:hypothetical protein CDL12_21691 [Handroanthus impetiginosus]